jgi:RNA polymerase sigma-70 factor (ECF subfamily)
MTWLKVMESSHLYQPSGQFKSWLFTIGRRLLIDELRRTKKLCSFDKGNVSHIESKDTTATMDRDENAALSLFNQLLEALPFEQKEAFCLQQEGFSLRDIAKITCCEQEAIKSRLRYAKRKLIDGLNKSDLSDSQS